MMRYKDHALEVALKAQTLPLRSAIENLLFDGGRKACHDAAVAPDPLGMGYSRPWGEGMGLERSRWMETTHCLAFYKSATMTSFQGWIPPKKTALSGHAKMDALIIEKRQKDNLEKTIAFLNQTFPLQGEEKLAVLVPAMSAVSRYVIRFFLDYGPGTSDRRMPFQAKLGLMADHQYWQDA